MSWLKALDQSKQRGSAPRCLLLLEGDRPTVAHRLQDLVNRPDVVITASDYWMPKGIPIRRPDGSWDKSPIKEAKLGEHADFNLSPAQREKLTDWWLTVPGDSNTPNWDIASTALIYGEKGLLLIEAKAHVGELRGAGSGKSISNPVNTNRRRNHVRIGWCIQDASLALTEETGLPWSLSRDWNYQMSNRFAWSWKLTELGYPVVLMYLGFLGAEDLSPNEEPLLNPHHWDRLVKEQSKPLFPSQVWGDTWTINDRKFLPLISALPLQLPPIDGDQA
jgi:hypothetical protein